MNGPSYVIELTKVLSDHCLPLPQGVVVSEPHFNELARIFIPEGPICSDKLMFHGVVIIKGI